MKHRMFVFVLILVAGGLASLALRGAPKAFAQEADKKEAPTVTREAVEETSDSDDEGDDDNFLPTEKINVDSSVSFPVDI